MKTAISIPDPVFKEADDLAERLGMSRSELYTKAVRSWIEGHRHDRVTETLNEIYAEGDSELDPVLSEMQWVSLPDEEW